MKTEATGYRIIRKLLSNDAPVPLESGDGLTETTKQKQLQHQMFPEH